MSTVRGISKCSSGPPHEGHHRSERQVREQHHMVIRTKIDFDFRTRNPVHRRSYAVPARRYFD